MSPWFTEQKCKQHYQNIQERQIIPRQIQTFSQQVHTLLQYNGIGRKIVTLVLNFAYRQNKDISVDSHVVKCAIALQWVHPQCTSPESIHVSLQEWVSPCMWPHVNMVLASFGQLFSNEDTTRHVVDIAMRDISVFQQLHQVLLLLVHLLST